MRFIEVNSHNSGETLLVSTSCVIFLHTMIRIILMSKQMKDWKLRENASLEERKALNTYCREIMKTKLLHDILMDINICKIEGWSYKEYVLELIDMLHDILRGKYDEADQAESSASDN